MKPITTSLDIAAVREKLRNQRGARYWRSLEEVADTPEFQEILHREFPPRASEMWSEYNRREFLKLASASLALAGLTACTKLPTQQIVPYVKQPEELVPGKPLFFATAMPFNGYAQGILVESHEGHPTKIEGNPEHPITRGASSSFMQAAILDLYDPDRSQAVSNAGEPSSWDAFLTDLNAALATQKAKGGAGIRILTETITSPTLASQIETIQKVFPKAKWHQYQPINRDNIYEGARLRFGEFVDPHYRFEKARIIVSFDSDFMLSEPASVRYIRGFADGRRVESSHNRFYAIESTPTLTGTNADHRPPLKSSDVPAMVAALAQKLGVENQTASGAPVDAERFISAVAEDLKHNQGASIIIAGEQQPPEVHALIYVLNEKLGNIGKTVVFTTPAEAKPVNQLESLRELVNDIRQGSVELLLIVGGNPVYTAPFDLAFQDAIQKVKLRVHLGLFADETSAFCHWHIPENHFLEDWSDARAFDGTVTILQPLIEPLYGGWSAHQLLEALIQQPVRQSYEIVREHWQKHGGWRDFDKSWRRALHDGIVSNSALPEKQVKAGQSPVAVPSRQPSPAPGVNEVEIVFRPDPSIWDGRFANNGWLQELAKPVTKLTWDNAALISPKLAERMHIESGDILELHSGAHRLKAPAFITPGQAENSITLYLGYGRSRSGRVGTGIGFNANALRTSEKLWITSGKISKTGEQYRLVTAQHHHAIGDTENRGVLFETTLAEFARDANVIQEQIDRPKPHETLYNPEEHKYDGYKWAMVIDLNTCVGCNACISACYSENNIPVVGKEQVARGREMYWIRVDTYFRGDLDRPTFSHQPVPCMHCENAPCELVCPVAATLHDHEGLNLQVYNRCVGTRYCSNNCPYKVRRFNFLQYADYKTESLKPMRNPNVTVRWRGVMEKCSYCIQRISEARIISEEADRRIREGEVRTACQQACPANAIIFGDLNDPDSKVGKLKTNPLNFDMLAGLNTRPRTSYLAKVRNPNPELEKNT